MINNERQINLSPDNISTTAARDLNIDSNNNFWKQIDGRQGELHPKPRFAPGVVEQILFGTDFTNANNPDLGISTSTNNRNNKGKAPEGTQETPALGQQTHDTPSTSTTSEAITDANSINNTPAPQEPAVTYDDIDALISERDKLIRNLWPTEKNTYGHLKGSKIKNWDKLGFSKELKRIFEIDMIIEKYQAAAKTTNTKTKETKATSPKLEETKETTTKPKETKASTSTKESVADGILGRESTSQKNTQYANTTSERYSSPIKNPKPEKTPKCKCCIIM
ncbi:MAG: hypothetical protein K5769_00815 [Pseudobutyrivibrio sp.]|nr:hypothetical protein [Pseudobutyrivibrio sp.]